MFLHYIMWKIIFPSLGISIALRGGEGLGYFLELQNTVNTHDDYVDLLPIYSHLLGVQKNRLKYSI